MIRTLFLFLFLTGWLTASAQTEVSAEFLHGAWSRIMMDQADSCLPPAEYVPRMPQDNKWIIQGDSISIYSFPSLFLGKYAFSVRSDSLFISTEYRVERFHRRKDFYATIHFEGSVLTLSMPECITMKFKRDTFSSETARLLKVLDQDTLNPYLLVGKYTMITHFVPDDEEAYDQFPPVKMKTIITIKDSVAARRLIHEATITLSVNGNLRKFLVESINFHGWYGWQPEGIPQEYHCEPEIIVTPGEWWHDESFRVHYQAKEQE